MFVRATRNYANTPSFKLEFPGYADVVTSLLVDMDLDEPSFLELRTAATLDELSSILAEMISELKQQQASRKQISALSGLLGRIRQVQKIGSDGYMAEIGKYMADHFLSSSILVITAHLRAGSIFKHCLTR